MGLLSIFFDNTYILHSVLQNRTLSFLPKIQIIIFQNVLTYEISTRYKPTEIMGTLLFQNLVDSFIFLPDKILVKPPVIITFNCNYFRIPSVNNEIWNEVKSIRT